MNKVFFVAAIVLCIVNSYGQKYFDEEEVAEFEGDRKHAIIFSPFHFLRGQFKMDYETYLLSDKIAVGASVLVGTNQRTLQEIDFNRNKIGFSLNGKLFSNSIQEINSNGAMFFGLGLGYTHYVYEYTDDVWRTYFEDGTKYYKLSLDEPLSASSGRVFAAPEFGYVWFSGNIYCDFYMGVHIFEDFESKNPTNVKLPYEESRVFNSKNAMLFAGFRIGFTF